MKKLLAKFVDEVWYRDHFIGTWLMPLSFLFTDIAKFRRWLYKKGYKPVEKLPVPVIIVGNITLGGTGKTPLVIYLVKQLKAAGFTPAVISRGYGGQSASWPVRVNAESDATLVGDEPLLIAQQADCPVAVGPVRAESARLLLQNEKIDVIISDDGLQHYALHRDIEIVVIDGERRFGNNFCLPSGPLREPQERIQEVDFIVCNGGTAEENEILMKLEGADAVNMLTQQRKPLAEFSSTNSHALAGIGNPQRFFDLLAKQGLACQTHAFPDHYAYTERDISFKSAQAIFMTEKDAVKCQSFASAQHWSVPVQVSITSSFMQQLIALLKT
ncbi:tetraacyldisaccharide 4'-kinase [Methyloprofundus sp.]|uniref:tetraacyldisaccharide 4'-kinase n=1 Tax=Methyloprofundus sp. TaxID=2020875 RepID=UPI003D11006B